MDRPGRIIRISNPQTGKGGHWQEAKGAIELCVHLRFRKRKIIGFRGLFARIANRCISLTLVGIRSSWSRTVSSYTNLILYGNMKCKYGNSESCFRR